MSFFFTNFIMEMAIHKSDAIKIMTIESTSGPTRHLLIRFGISHYLPIFRFEFQKLFRHFLTPAIFTTL